MDKRYRLFKRINEDEEEIKTFSQDFLSCLMVNDEISIDDEDDEWGSSYYKVTSRTFYEDEKGIYCEIMIKEIEDDTE